MLMNYYKAGLVKQSVTRTKTVLVDNRDPSFHRKCFTDGSLLQTHYRMVPIAVAVSAGRAFQLRLLPADKYPLAVCSDGSRAGYFIRRASETQQDWLIYLQGILSRTFPLFQNAQIPTLAQAGVSATMMPRAGSVGRVVTARCAKVPSPFVEAR